MSFYAGIVYQLFINRILRTFLLMMSGTKFTNVPEFIAIKCSHSEFRMRERDHPMIIRPRQLQGASQSETGNSLLVQVYLYCGVLGMKSTMAKPLANAHWIILSIANRAGERFS